jgi:hypothetical protein
MCVCMCVSVDRVYALTCFNQLEACEQKHCILSPTMGMCMDGWMGVVHNGGAVHRRHSVGVLSMC